MLVYFQFELMLSDDNYYKPDGAGDNYYPNPIGVYEMQNEKYDEYLNNLYSDIKNKISEEAFNKLKEDKRQWIKDKDDYLKTTNFQGNEAYPQTGKFYVDVTKFRCLLLILYLS